MSSFLCWLALQNLRALKSPKGYLNAGLPHFNCLYGRDSIISALELLPIDPSYAKNTLLILASLQGKDIKPQIEEEPGKILHEYREKDYKGLIDRGWFLSGDKLIYYGSVDATPLWIILFYEYISFTKDWETLQKLWPAAKQALAWIETFADKDSDGFIEYQSQNSACLYNQGWKDSWDAVSMKNGDIAKSPIAVAEAQGYVYQAKRMMAELYRMTGDINRYKKLLKDAEALKIKFNEAFWMEDEEFYALALDKYKNKAEVISSNVGHLLFTGIVPKERQEKVVQRLFRPDIKTPWGIRTLSSKEVRYDPDSYHNGSIWPHDNWMIFIGLKKCGFYEEAYDIAFGMIDAFSQLDCIPELFAANGELMMYQKACRKQSWSSGACLSFLYFLYLNNSIFTRTIY